MAVFRVEKTKRYTVMSNHHLQNRELSLKAKGLLSEMLSLPETWDYTLKGLAIINKEGVDAIREAVRELERNGYIVRSRVRNAKGQLTHTEYVIYEQPANASVADGQPKLEEPMQGKPILEKPTQEDPIQDHSTLDNPTLENPTQINTYELTTDQKKKKEKIPDGSNPYQSIPYPSMRGRGQPFSVYQIRAQVKEQIEYDILCEQYDSPQLDDIVALMVDVRCGKTESYVISDVEYPAELVQEHFENITSSTIQYVLDCLSKQIKRIGNIRAYLLTTLYNATSTESSYYDAMVRHDHPYLTFARKESIAEYEPIE